MRILQAGRCRVRFTGSPQNVRNLSKKTEQSVKKFGLWTVALTGIGSTAYILNSCLRLGQEPEER